MSFGIDHSLNFPAYCLMDGIFLLSFPLTFYSPPFHREKNTFLRSGLRLKNVPTTDEFSVNWIYLNNVNPGS